MALTISYFQVTPRHEGDEDAGWYFWRSDEDEPRGPYPMKGTAQRMAEKSSPVAA